MVQGFVGSFGTVFRNWRESLGFFAPQEITTIFLASLVTWFRSSVSLLVYFSWWLLFIVAYLDMYVLGSGLFGYNWSFVAKIPYLEYGALSYIRIVFVMLLSYAVHMVVRASVEQKNSLYFFSYLGRLLFIGPVFFLVPHLTLFPIYWLIVFFFLDSEFSFESMYRSIRNGMVMAINYAPFFAIVGWIPLGFFRLQEYLWGFTLLDEGDFRMFILKYVLSVFVHVFFISIIAVVYTKIKHSSTGLFAKDSGKSRPRRRRGTRMTKTRVRKPREESEKKTATKNPASSRPKKAKTAK